MFKNQLKATQRAIAACIDDMEADKPNLLSSRGERRVP
jgi:hypothetical protein